MADEDLLSGLPTHEQMDRHVATRWIKANPTEALRVLAEAGPKQLVVGEVTDAMHHGLSTRGVTLEVRVPEGEYEWLLDERVAVVRMAATSEGDDRA